MCVLNVDMWSMFSITVASEEEADDPALTVSGRHSVLARREQSVERATRELVRMGDGADWDAIVELAPMGPIGPVGPAGPAFQNLERQIAHLPRRRRIEARHGARVAVLVLGLNHAVAAVRPEALTVSPTGPVLAAVGLAVVAELDPEVDEPVAAVGRELGVIS